MKKSIDRREYRVLLGLLRAVRLEAHIPQTDLSNKLARPQTFVSAVELGRVRLDMLQVNDWCRACSADLVVFAQRFKDGLAAMPKKPAKGEAASLRKPKKRA